MERSVNSHRLCTIVGLCFVTNSNFLSVVFNVPVFLLLLPSSVLSIYCALLPDLHHENTSQLEFALIFVFRISSRSKKISD